MASVSISIGASMPLPNPPSLMGLEPMNGASHPDTSVYEKFMEAFGPINNARKQLEMQTAHVHEFVFDLKQGFKRDVPKEEIDKLKGLHEAHLAKLKECIQWLKARKEEGNAAEFVFIDPQLQELSSILESIEPFSSVLAFAEEYYPRFDAMRKKKALLETLVKDAELQSIRATSAAEEPAIIQNIIATQKELIAIIHDNWSLILAASNNDDLHGDVRQFADLEISRLETWHLSIKNSLKSVGITLDSKSSMGKRKANGEASESPKKIQKTPSPEKTEEQILREAAVEFFKKTFQALIMPFWTCKPEERANLLRSMQREWFAYFTLIGESPESAKTHPGRRAALVGVIKKFCFDLISHSAKQMETSLPILLEQGALSPLAIDVSLCLQLVQAFHIEEAGVWRKEWVTTLEDFDAYKRAEYFIHEKISPLCYRLFETTDAPAREAILSTMQTEWRSFLGKFGATKEYATHLENFFRAWIQGIMTSEIKVVTSNHQGIHISDCAIRSNKDLFAYFLQISEKACDKMGTVLMPSCIQVCQCLAISSWPSWQEDWNQALMAMKEMHEGHKMIFHSLYRA